MRPSQSKILLAFLFPISTTSFSPVGFQKGEQVLPHLLLSASWKDIEHELGESFRADRPISIDSVLDTSTPKFSTDRPTLFRERHGWCPYSERVWLALELGNVEYDTVRIDNTGGGRPSYFGGTTPQMKWPDGKTQGESMDLVYRLDEEYDLGFQSDSSKVRDCVSQFQSIFPRARPSSRAAYLFQYNGSPLSRSTFEQTLQGVDDLLAQSSNNGPFFCGDALTAADIGWAPFLERYRYQLPCLHRGLEPNDPEKYPHLAEWYKAMDQIPEYICRVRGDASSWRKVLNMAGFGNAGLPPEIEANIEERLEAERVEAEQCINVDTWKDYASTRAFAGKSPGYDVACIIAKNRDAILKDALKNGKKQAGMSSEIGELDNSLQSLALALMGDEVAKSERGVKAFAQFLDMRMCVPRDMGAMSAATIKLLAVEE